MYLLIKFKKDQKSDPFFRFDGVGAQTTSKFDPTFKKYESASQMVIQMLLAAANGDKRALQRWWLQVYKDEKIL